MPLGSKTVTRQLELAFEAGSRAKDLAARVETELLQELTPHFIEGKAPPDIRYLLELLSSRFDSLAEALSASDFERQNQVSLTRFQKDEERRAAQAVRTLLIDVRYLLDRTLGKAKAKQHFEGRSSLVKMGFPVLARVGEKLVKLMRDETVDWDMYPADDHLPTRAVLSAKLETALSELRRILGASRPDRTALSHTSSNWLREREEKNVSLRRQLKLLQGFLIAAGFELEAAALQPRQRKAAPVPDEEKGSRPNAPISCAPGMPSLEGSTSPPAGGTVWPFPVQVAASGEAGAAEKPAKRGSRKSRLTSSGKATG